MKELKAKKSLGQNFLIDENILSKIAFSTNAKDGDLIIEIGPGKGALTKKLKETNAFIIAYEIDERMHEFLDKLEDVKTKVIYGDILKQNIYNDIKDLNYSKIYVIANIPYYITTPIIKIILNSGLNIDNIVLLVQKEVAERLTAKPGTREYGSLTVYLNYFFEIKKLFIVKAGSFNPSPKVDSAVVNFTRVYNYVKNEDKLFQLITDSFKFKRKTLKKNLNNYNWEKIILLLHEYGYKDTVRAEELPLELFIKIADIVCNNL